MLYHLNNTKASATFSFSFTICLCVVVAPIRAEFGDLLYTFTDADSMGDDAFSSGVAVSDTMAIVGSGLSYPNPLPQNVHRFDLSTGAERYKLVRSEVMAADGLGYSVAIDGNILIAGAGNHASVGEAYVFDASTGQKIRQLRGATQVPRDLFGESVAIDGDKAIVGAYGPFPFEVGSGAAYVFDVTSGQELFKFPAGDAWGDQFGHGVDISGNIAIVGAPSQHADANNAGAAYLYDVTTGQRLRKLRASDASTSDNFGQSVAIDGNIAIVGSAPFSGSGAGAYVFDVTTGQQLFKLVSSDGFAGSPVAISGNTAIVGPYLFDVTTGKELLKLTAPEPNGFGGSVAIDGNRAIVGANRFGVPGAAYVFDVTRIPGDFNNDGTVDAADYVVWRKGMGTQFPQAHYEQWRANFGAATAAAAAGANSANLAVPEPNAIVLFALMFSGTLAARCKARRFQRIVNTKTKTSGKA